MFRIILTLFLTISSATFLFGQSEVLRGKIMDEQNVPIAGARVLVEGTTNGVMSNADGEYSIKVEMNQTVVFNFTGMITQKVQYKGENALNIVMAPLQETLDEVVMIGYQTVKKADLTGAVSVFNPELMQNRTVTGNVGDVLGSLPSVMVRTEGKPGAEGKVVIRGAGTFGNSNPLYVVDGVISGANRDFNFNDIESIQVLKDASAAAIYGSRAANGVVIITTKQGQQGDMKIDISSRITLQTLPKYDLANRDKWIALNDLAFGNAGKAPANHFDANTNWQDVVFKTGVIHDHNISFSGGGEKNKYFLSANYQRNSGTTIGTKSERFTVRSNMSSFRNFGENLKLTVGENFAISYYDVNELNTNPIIDVYRMLPTIPVYDENNAHLGGYGFGNHDRDVTFGTNPVAKENLEDTRNANFRARGNLFAQLDIFKMFKYKFNFGANISSDRYRYLRKVGHWTYNQPKDDSNLNKNQAFYSSLLFDNTLEFDKQFGKHHISAVLGLSYQKTSYERIWGTKTNVMTSGDSYFTNLDAALENPNTGNYQDLEKMFSAFGRINYNFDDRYLLSFTIRRDESSKFHPDKRVGYFPSIAGAWRISQEQFFNSGVINDLKLRVNYGVLGNSNIGVWDYVNFMENRPQVIFGDDQNIHYGMIQMKLVNEYLKWEKLAQMNAGFDISLLGNRFDFSFDYYIKESKDVLTQMPILGATGNSGGNPWVNAASLRNTGFEISTTWRDKVGSFNYSATLNLSYLKNKIKEFGYKVDQLTTWATKSIKGKPIGEWHLIRTDGIFRTQEEIDNYKTSDGRPIMIADNKRPQLGDVKYIDANDDGIITDGDRRYAGSSIPKYQIGINLTAEYKGLDFLAQFTGAWGHKLFNGPRSAYDKFDDNSSYRNNYDPWSLENPKGKDPRPIYDDARNVRGDQDRWLESGSYLRLAQLSLGYTIPKHVLGNVIDNIRVYVSAQNLFTITGYKGLDPEFLNGNLWMRGYDGGAFPNPRGFTFGVQVTF